MKLIFPDDVPRRRRRAPTGIDMAVLFRMLMLARLNSSRTFDIDRPATLARKLGLRHGGTASDSISDALDLWHDLSIYFNQFAVGSDKGPRQFPPPIYREEGDSITLHPDWFELAMVERGYGKIDWPVPTNSVIQNIVLYASAFSYGAQTAEFRSPASLAMKIGLNSESPSAHLRNNVFPKAAEYLERQGRTLELDWPANRKTIRFKVTKFSKRSENPGPEQRPKKKAARKTKPTKTKPAKDRSWNEFRYMPEQGSGHYEYDLQGNRIWVGEDGEDV
ncbi:MAG: hypothetical protein E5X72_30160 [Mesorhizobium sp.]|uniref:hypothetical protein n=1 Tax=Mesorhizobium sp. TaxID=1871066 RepID=UPI001203AF67|nr:hypothetical protein [Mesorhizobium sp.]TIP00378.1 MAG: hypothetical protein E5X72_30160 [Mesorhizobium sp.]